MVERERGGFGIRLTASGPLTIVRRTRVTDRDDDNTINDSSVEHTMRDERPCSFAMLSAIEQIIVVHDTLVRGRQGPRKFPSYGSSGWSRFPF